ncbi:response regulator [Mucilaginibacter sp. PAMB04274]|uniref:response regulator n=1 Tax=Mucilaginibacter sp. PAMB04274 TaxID=3138568 RepID=UPI0031F6E918
MTGQRILIIEDSPDIADVLSSILTDEGYKVTARTEASDIVKLVIDNQPDLIITDYILEGINGGEYCATLKRDERTSHIPVIILSGYGKLLESLGDYGADKIVDKPFDNAHLLITVAGLL